MLPAGVYKHGARYRMRTYTGAEKTPGWYVFRAKGLGALYKEWAKYFRKDEPTFSDIFRRYELNELPKKAPDTQQSDLKALKQLRQTFGPLRTDEVTPPLIVAYVDARGAVAPVRANREVELLSAVFTKCLHWGFADTNPCHQLRYKNPELPRDRYVTDRELQVAMRLAPPLVRYALRLCQITGLRRRDLLTLDWSAYTPGVGLVVELSKSRRRGARPKRLLFEDSPALYRVFRRISDCTQTTDGLVFGLSESQFDRAWSDLQKSVVAAGIERFQMKDIRAKCATDLAEQGGDATRTLAHSSASTTLRHYNRKPTRITPQK